MRSRRAKASSPLPRIFLKAFAIGICFATPGVPLIAYFHGNWYSLFHSYSIAMLFGIFSFGYFLNTLILAARIPVLDRLFGHDRVMLFHGLLAQLAAILAACHLIFKLIYRFPITSQVALGIGALSLFCGIMCATTLLMTAGIFGRVRVIAEMKSAIRAYVKVDYSRMKLLHNLTAAGAMLMAIHAALASSTGETPIRTAIIIGWAALAAGAYLYHKGIRPVVNASRGWRIERVTELAPGIAELQMKNTANREMHNCPGQFAYFRIRSLACGFEEHPFTITSLPSSKTVSITVKNLGDYTARLRSVMPGSAVLIDGPYGAFTPPANNHPRLFVAGGIGITPFISIIGIRQKEGGQGAVTLVWSVRNEEELFCRDLFDSLQARDAGFRFMPLISRGHAGTAPRRIDRGLLQSAVGTMPAAALEVYICGPEEMRRSVATLVQDIGISNSRIRFERFS